MTIGHIPPAGLDCPLCSGRLHTWARAELLVDFCNCCSALFLDRGEFFGLFRSEGYDCPPEAMLRVGFAPLPGDSLECPKCQTETLRPGAVQGAEMWHCQPCNGFLVDRALLLGETLSDASPHEHGFQVVDERSTVDGDGVGSESRMGVFERLFLWARSGR